MREKDKKAVFYQKHKTEQQLSHIGAKLADAHDISEEISSLTDKQEETLAKAQSEISDLYETLDEK